MNRLTIMAFILVLAAAPMATLAASDLVIKPVGDSQHNRVTWVPGGCKQQGSGAMCWSIPPKGATVTASVYGRSGAETCYLDFSHDEATGRWILHGTRGSSSCHARMVGNNVLEFGGVH
jgi:hypothetical protein